MGHQWWLSQNIKVLNETRKPDSKQTTKKISIQRKMLRERKKRRNKMSNRKFNAKILLCKSQRHAHKRHSSLAWSQLLERAMILNATRWIYAKNKAHQRICVWASEQVLFWHDAWTKEIECRQNKAIAEACTSKLRRIGRQMFVQTTFLFKFYVIGIIIMVFM